MCVLTPTYIEIDDHWFWSVWALQIKYSKHSSGRKHLENESIFIMMRSQLLFFISTPKNIHPSKLIYFLYLTVFLMGLFLLSTCGLKHCIHTHYVCLYSWIFDCALMDFWKVNRSVASSLRSTELSLQTHRWLFCAITSKYNLSNVTQTALML